MLISLLLLVLHDTGYINIVKQIIYEWHENQSDYNVAKFVLWMYQSCQTDYNSRNKFVEHLFCRYSHDLLLLPQSINNFITKLIINHIKHIGISVIIIYYIIQHKIYLFQLLLQSLQVGLALNARFWPAGLHAQWKEKDNVKLFHLL